MNKNVCQTITYHRRKILEDFPGGTVVKNPSANAGDTGSTLVWEYPTCQGATKPVRHNY